MTAAKKLGKLQADLLERVIAAGGLKKAQMGHSKFWRVADNLARLRLIARRYDHVYVVTEEGLASLPAPGAPLNKGNAHQRPGISGGADASRKTGVCRSAGPYTLSQADRQP
jgi:hypothetical protein